MDRFGTLLAAACVILSMSGCGAAGSSPSDSSTVLYSFGASSTDGVAPHGLIQGADGNFYGVTDGGGAHAGGTFFKITPAGVESVVYSFGASSTDGTNPESVIQGADGNFYGTTAFGGNGDGCHSTSIGPGTFYMITPAGVETVLYVFGASDTDGAGPTGGVIQGADGNFYGTTFDGGAFAILEVGCSLCNYGTVYKITPTGAESVVYSFGASSSDGTSPGSVIQGTDGNFYGTTATGGANGYGGQGIGVGTVYKITPAGVETILHSFGASSADGIAPDCVIQGKDGNLYGVTGAGGANGGGTLFMITPAGEESVLYSFGPSTASITNLWEPSGGVIQGADGNLYGFTSAGGTNGDGTIFKYTP